MSAPPLQSPASAGNGRYKAKRVKKTRSFNKRLNLPPAPIARWRLGRANRFCSKAGIAIEGLR